MGLEYLHDWASPMQNGRDAARIPLENYILQAARESFKNACGCQKAECLYVLLCTCSLGKLAKRVRHQSMRTAVEDEGACHRQ
ncbi:hypothetical protein AVEN_135273-1 [Araneus ventricosus]|uniref:Uncharacterized protein n=1 Tax=Araneus ventricosus TaxID=182803 RepID=A0A4Y2CQ57_ARAVE|nr:hypothetical protein AVEN_135273-1 [Araneus ventricosus]